jgi:hypothetical protein
MCWHGSCEPNSSSLGPALHWIGDSNRLQPADLLLSPNNVKTGWLMRLLLACGAPSSGYRQEPKTPYDVVVEDCRRRKEIQHSNLRGRHISYSFLFGMYLGNMNRTSPKRLLLSPHHRNTVAVITCV